jgi:16S rRNA U516 pseudouridylate synthase RsuA-like enzyme
LKVRKMWDQAMALDLQSKAEDYLLEHKPEGYRRSTQAEEGRRQLRLGIDRAYYRRDAAQHKNAVDEMVLDTLKEYANWYREH